MFTGLVEDWARSPRSTRPATACACACAAPLAARARRGRLGRGQRRLPDRRARSPAARFGADVMPETLRRSSLGERRRGARVNLELPLRAADRLGGHIVQGHVDGVGTVGDGRARTASPASDDRRAAGAAALRGREGLDRGRRRQPDRRRVDDGPFSVSLIPETLERTTLGAAAPAARQPGGGRARQVRGEAGGDESHERRRSRRSRRRSRRSAPAGWWSSATTRTARTRATS